MKILKYNVLVAVTAERLTEMVNKAINDGWQPFGNLSTEHRYLCQPMVIYSEETFSVS